MALWISLLSLPLAGLVLLLARPELDVTWEHHPAHFWLVLATAAVNVGLALATGEAARRLRDGRLFGVSLAFATSAGFLGLHALATPGVVLGGANAGFVVATPIGLVLAAALAALSATERATWLLRHERALRAAVLAAVAGWAVASLAEIRPLADALPPEEAEPRLATLALIGVPLYAFAAFRYGRLFAERRQRVTGAVAAAFVLLAEALVAVAAARNWHASWWEWHVLMTIGFALIAAAARDEYRRTRSLARTFGGVYLASTLERLDDRFATGLERMTAAVGAGDASTTRDELRRDGFSADEVAALERAAREVQRIDTLFRPYLSPRLAERLEREPDLARLGGEEREVSVLFADLVGFTTYSEARDPAEVVALLNEYWGAVVPEVAHEGGLVERFAGDAVMVVFNVAGDQPDHAVRACRAALGLQRAAARVAAARPGAPPFRVGVNTGRTIVGNVGADDHRSFTAIGDATNAAARLQALAEPGAVVVSGTTAAALGEDAALRPLGPLPLKGRREPVEAFVLEDVSAPEPLR